MRFSYCLLQLFGQCYTERHEHQTGYNVFNETTKMVEERNECTIVDRNVALN
jgi:hypothetical protein